MLQQHQMQHTYANVEFVQRMFAKLGYLLFTRAVLDDPEILSSAPKEVQIERARVLALRCERQNIPSNSRSVRVPPNQVDLNTVGSGLLAGGISAYSDGLFNTTNGTASTLFDLLHQSKTATDDRRGINKEIR